MGQAGGYRACALLARAAWAGSKARAAGSLRSLGNGEVPARLKDPWVSPALVPTPPPTHTQTSRRGGAHILSARAQGKSELPPLPPVSPSPTSPLLYFRPLRVRL